MPVTTGYTYLHTLTGRGLGLIKSGPAGKRLFRALRRGATRFGTSTPGNHTGWVEFLPAAGEVTTPTSPGRSDPVWIHRQRAGRCAGVDAGLLAQAAGAAGALGVSLVGALLDMASWHLSAARSSRPRV